MHCEYIKLDSLMASGSAEFCLVWFAGLGVITDSQCDGTLI